MIAGRRECVNGAFEAVERVRLAAHRDLKRLVVVVAAGFALTHDVTFFHIALFDRSGAASNTAAS